MQTLLTNIPGSLEKASKHRTSRVFTPSISSPLRCPCPMAHHLVALIFIFLYSFPLREHVKPWVMSLKLSTYLGESQHEFAIEWHFPLPTFAHPFLLSHSVSSSVERVDCDCHDRWLLFTYLHSKLCFPDQVPCLLSHFIVFFQRMSSGIL